MEATPANAEHPNHTNENKKAVIVRGSTGGKKCAEVERSESCPRYARYSREPNWLRLITSTVNSIVIVAFHHLKLGAQSLVRLL